MFYKQNLFLRNYVLTGMSGTVILSMILTKMQWNLFLKDLLASRAVFVRRHVLCCTQRNVELHCDSSAQACCAVVFVRVICSHGVSVTLWTGKCRYALMKNFSIARLELLVYCYKSLLEWLLRQFKWK